MCLNSIFLVFCSHFQGHMRLDPRGGGGGGGGGVA